MFTKLRFSLLKNTPQALENLLLISSVSRANLVIQSAYSKIMVKQGPRPLVVCGPSGSGKSTLLKKLFAEFPETFGFSVSHTTRKPRAGEEDGVHYNFVTLPDMQKAIENNEFLETATFSGNMYGTSIQGVRNVQQQGKVCVLDIEIQGVKQIRSSDLNPVLIFIMPPSISELERRLTDRKSETPESLQQRLNTAKIEIEYGQQPGNFHIVIHNIDVKEAYEKLRDFVVKELESQTNEGINVKFTRIEKKDD